MLRESGWPLAPLVEGVRQENFEELERTLRALAEEYEAGDKERKKKYRRVVMEGKDHAKFATRRAKDEAVRARKTEMVEWMMVWLENPGIFPAWVELRKRAR